MTNRRFHSRAIMLLVTITLVIIAGSSGSVAAQSSGPIMLHPQLGVRPVVSGLDLPTSLAFLGANDILVLEKNTGKVQRVVNGVVQTTVLDLAVNFASERGLL